MDSLTGKCWVFGDNIDTDLIIAARYLNTTDEKELASHLMEDARDDFTRLIAPGDFIVAGENFGCGSSREHAPLAIRGAGIKAVIAKSFARIFYRNAFNTGLLIFEISETDQIQEGDQLQIDIDAGEIHNQTQNTTYRFAPVPPFMQELVECGGLIPYAKKELEKQAS